MLIRRALDNRSSEIPDETTQPSRRHIRQSRPRIVGSLVPLEDSRSMGAVALAAGDGSAWARHSQLIHSQAERCWSGRSSSVGTELCQSASPQWLITQTATLTPSAYPAGENWRK